MEERTKYRHSAAIVAALVAMAACYYVYLCNFCVVGDDLRLTEMWIMMREKYGLLAWPAIQALRYLISNGRLLEPSTAIFVHVLPMPVAKLILAATYSLLAYTILRSIDFAGRSFTAKAFVIALFVATLPWWDGLYLVVVWLDYEVGPLVTLAFLLYFFKRDGRKASVIGIVFAILAGVIHEAVSIPVTVGLTLWYYLNRRSQATHRRRNLIIAYAAGMLVCLASPGIWYRLMAPMTAAKSYGEVLITSNFYVIVLIAFIAIALLIRRTRPTVIALARTPWIVYVTVALLSCVISMKSGIIGRTGMFAQIFALIAIFNLALQWRPRIGRISGGIIGSLLLAATLFHLVTLAIEQRKANAEFADVIALYAESADGYVYYDYSRDQDRPWWLLKRIWGVPDPDDVWVLRTVTNHYGNESEPLTVLPAVLADGTLLGNTREFPIAAGHDYVTDQLPQVKTVDTYENIPLTVFTGNIAEGTDGKLQLKPYAGGTEYIVQPFSQNGCTYYLLSERDIDPGD